MVCVNVSCVTKASYQSCFLGVIDFAFIQQDSFDDTDMNSSLERQSFMLNRVLEICDKPQEFEDFSAVSAFYKKVINLFKQMNYSDFESDDFQKFNSELEALFNLQSIEAWLPRLFNPYTVELRL